MVSATVIIHQGGTISTCLNPYYTGRWFLLTNILHFQKHSNVLILIILEDGFCLIRIYLIKVLVFRLNPYYTGRWFLLSAKTATERKM